MATLHDTWSLRAVYAFLGFPGVTTLPRAFGGTFTYAGLRLDVEPTREKRNKLYRVLVTCTCGKQVSFCKFPYHARSKRHKGDTFTCLTTQAIEIDAERLATLRDTRYTSRPWTDAEIRERFPHMAYLLGE